MLITNNLKAETISVTVFRKMFFPVKKLRSRHEKKFYQFPSYP